MSDLAMILGLLVVGGVVVVVLNAFVVRGYRDAVAEPSTCPKCRKRRPGQFCSRCGHKKF